MNIPEGYMENAQGHLVPVAQVRPIDKARDEFVKETVAKAREVQRIIRDFKRESMSGISAFVQLSAERYGAKIGGEKGNVTLETYDRKLRLVRQVSETLAFDEGLMAAKALIDECLSDWCEQAPGELRAVVEQAFRVNKEGRINTNAVLALRKLNISDERWMNAMQAFPWPTPGPISVCTSGTSSASTTPFLWTWRRYRNVAPGGVIRPAPYIRIEHAYPNRSQEAHQGAPDRTPQARHD